MFLSIDPESDLGTKDPKNFSTLGEDGNSREMKSGLRIGDHTLDSAWRRQIEKNEIRVPRGKLELYFRRLLSYRSIKKSMQE